MHLHDRKRSKTWPHYKDYIINSFIIYNGKRLSNGPIEGINKRVKELKNVMSGYRNSARFYKRLVLIHLLYFDQIYHIHH